MDIEMEDDRLNQVKTEACKFKIKTEVSKLKKKFVYLSEEKQVLANRLIDEVAYMGVTIEELQEMVNTDGPVLTMINGNGFVTRIEHPAQKSYNTTIKNYLSSIKQLNELLPDSKTEGVEKAGNTLKAFIDKGKK